jgi:cytoskeletal protein RodZ
MADTAAPSGGGGKVLGLKPRTAIIAGGGILLLAVGYFLWKKHQAAATPATQSASASSSTSGIDYGGELSVIQSELEDVLAAEGQSSSSTGTSSTTGTGTSSTGTSSTGTSSTGTATTTAAKTAPPMPTGVHATAETATTVSLAWSPSAGATSYQIRVTYQGKLVTSGTASGTTRVVNGLSPNRTYTFHIKACNSAGCSSETNGPAVKTKL